MTINLFRRLQNLQPEAPVLYATVVVRLGATARVEFPGGGTSIVNNPSRSRQARRCSCAAAP